MLNQYRPFLIDLKFCIFPHWCQAGKDVDWVLVSHLVNMQMRTVQVEILWKCNKNTITCSVDVHTLYVYKLDTPSPVPSPVAITVLSPDYYWECCANQGINHNLLPIESIEFPGISLKSPAPNLVRATGRWQMKCQKYTKNPIEMTWKWWSFGTWSLIHLHSCVSTLTFSMTDDQGSQISMWIMVTKMEYHFHKSFNKMLWVPNMWNVRVSFSWLFPEGTSWLAWDSIWLL